MEILFLSDTHGRHREIDKSWLPKADAIFHGGDYSSIGTEKQTADFMDWFSKLDQYKYRLTISGNHDKLSERNPTLFKTLIPDNVIYLEDSGIELEGLKIWGSPVSPTFGYDWAWNRDRGSEIEKHWSKIPADTEILISHTPMHGVLDMCLNGDVVGCRNLLHRVSQLPKIKVVQVAHIHEARGIARFVDNKLCINASTLNARYDVVNKPFLLDTKDWRIL